MHGKDEGVDGCTGAQFSDAQLRLPLFTVPTNLERVFRVHPRWTETLVCRETLVQGAVVGVSSTEVTGSGSGAASTTPLPLLELDDENDPVMQARTASGGGSATLPVTLPFSTVNAGRQTGPTDPTS